MDSSNSGKSSAPPPYSDISDVRLTGENSANSSPSLSQLLDKKNVFQISSDRAIGDQVVDGNGTELLSILRQPVFGMDWRVQNLFLNSTGKPVMEMTRIVDKDAPVSNRTWTVYEGGRVAGILRHLDDKRELVGYRTSGKEMFRAVERAPYSLTVRGDGKDLAVIATDDNRSPTSLVIFNQDVQLEVKALLLSTALFYHCVTRHPVIPAPDYLRKGRQIAQKSQGSTWANRLGNNGSIRDGALETTIRVFILIILAIIILFLPSLLMKEL